MSLSERFKRLPEEQQLRSEESARQASEASELLKRLRTTRQEAERVAKEEIERTRRVQREELEVHPEVVDLKRRLRNAERERDIWERKQKDQERSYQTELDNLKREETSALNRFNFAQEEEMKARQEQESMQRERTEKEAKFKELDMKMDNLKREEESQFINDTTVLKKQIQSLEGSQPNFDLKANLSQIENEIRSIEDSQDRNMAEREKLAEKELQAAKDLEKARELHEKAKSIEGDKLAELDFIKSTTISGTETFSSVEEAEERVQELETFYNSVKREQEFCNKTIEEKGKRIELIRSEIERLKDELNELERSQSADYGAFYDLENKEKRFDFDLREAREHLHDIKERRDYFLQEKKRNEERLGQLEQEIGAARRAKVEAEAEEKRASDLCAEIGKRCNETDLTLKNQTDRLEQLNRTAMDLRVKLENYERVNSEIDQLKSALNEVQHRRNEWRINRFAPIQNEFERLKIWLLSHPKIEAISTGRSVAAWNDLERIRKRINELQNKYPVLPVTFENPETVRGLLEDKEQEIKSRLAARSGPISQRLASQLEREAEALMRAEVAATHERKQEAIEREANELSQLRLSLKPQVALDQEAQNKLWQVNQETGETGAIAAQVLQLCQSRNITVKEQE